MGLLVDGVWRDDSFDKARMEGGRFNRPTTKFRNWVTPDGSPGPSGEGGFPAEAGRYHLYVSLACPWAHRTIIFRHLKRLENVISMSVTSWHMGENGWTFDTEEGSSGDPVNGAQKLSEIYLLADAKYTGRVTVPVLWDKKRKPSSATNRPRSSGCSTRRSTPLTNERTDYYPPDLRSEIDAVNDLVYRERQQRRLSRRLRHRAGRLRGGVPQRVRGARRHRAPAVDGSAMSPARA